jgi:hypothetical protein
LEKTRETKMKTNLELSKLESRLLRRLGREPGFRPLQEGVLSNHILMRVRELPFQEALAHLLTIGLVTVTNNPWGSSRAVQLTDAGKNLVPELRAQINAEVAALALKKE